MKSDSAFHKNSKSKDGLQSKCKMCNRESRKAHYATPRGKELKKISQEKYLANIREWIWKYLDENPCVDCGEKDKIVLEFDHRDRSEKSATIANMVKGSNLEKIKLEIAKCDVRCANCHRRRTAKQLGWFKALAETPA